MLMKAGSGFLGEVGSGDVAYQGRLMDVQYPLQSQRDSGSEGPEFNMGHR